MNQCGVMAASNPSQTSNSKIQLIFQSEILLEIITRRICNFNQARDYLRCSVESRLSREKANQGQTEWHIQLKTPQADAV